MHEIYVYAYLCFWVQGPAEARACWVSDSVIHSKPEAFSQLGLGCLVGELTGVTVSVGQCWGCSHT